MSYNDDFQAFKSRDGGEPTVGNHTATLVRAVIRDTQNGTKIVLEWQTPDLAYYWTSWHGVTGGQRQFTQKTLDELGIDLDAIGNWDEMGDALMGVEGLTYIVAVTRKGDFLNTNVLERPDAVQTAIPVATPPAQPRSAIFDDDDIPF